MAYENGTTWDYTNYVLLDRNTLAWTEIAITAPASSSYVRLLLIAKQNGGSDYAAWDSITLTSACTDNVAPNVTAVNVLSDTTIQVVFDEKMDSATAVNPINYLGITVSQVSLNNSKTVATLKTNILQGKSYTLNFQSLKDSVGNGLTPFSYSFLRNTAVPNLIFTEIMYNSVCSSIDTLDFVEIYNNENTPVAIGGLIFNNGDDLTLPEMTLPAKGFVLIAEDALQAGQFYNKTFLQYLGTLSNGGELLTLKNKVGDLIDEVNYDDANPWPTGSPTPDGDGSSLELVLVANDNNDGANWKASENAAGSWNQGQAVFANPGSYTAPVNPLVDFDKALHIFNEGSGIVQVPIKISNSQNTTASFDIAVSLSSNVNIPVDLTLFNASFSIKPNSADTIVNLSITIIEDLLAESDEYLMLRIKPTGNSEIGTLDNTTIYIKDNDTKAPVANKQIGLKYVSSYEVNGGAEKSAEISAYDPKTKRLFVANSLSNILNVLDFKTPANISEIKQVDLSSYGVINGVAVYDNMVALAMENSNKQLPGKIVLMDTDGVLIKTLDAGVLPDMITFSNDRKQIVTANEGEPNTDLSIDPLGSITIVDFNPKNPSAVTQSNVYSIDFTSFNGQEAALKAAGVRIFTPGGTVATDLEPEYVTINATNDTAYVVCQENNALAVIDLKAKTILGVLPLELKDHSLQANAADFSDRSGDILFTQWKGLKGMYMPDAITNYKVGNKTYLITANEGDAREYDAFEEETSASKEMLDSTIFPDQDILKQNFNLGRLGLTNVNGDTDNDRDFDELHAFGARSFSIWDAKTGSVTWDSKDDIERIIANHPGYKRIFNASNSSTSFKNRSDNKGPEPEGVTVGYINDTAYAFVGLERIGGVIAYDIKNPARPKFADYANSRDSLSHAGDLGAEGIIFIDRFSSPDDKHYVILSNEVSATLSVYEVEAYYPPIAKVGFDINAGNVEEGNKSSFILRLSNPLPVNEATVEITVNPGAGLNSNEYKITPAPINDLITVQFTGRQTTVSFEVEALTDTENEQEELLVLGIKTTSTGAVIGGFNKLFINIKSKNSINIDLATEGSIKIYPNPAITILHFSETMSGVLMDMQGKVVQSFENQNQIDLQSIHTGMFLIRFTDGTTVKVAKQ